MLDTRSRHRLAAILFAGALTATLPAGDAPPKAGGPGKPLAPQEALKHFHLDAGLRIELVACEPQIESPVAMAFSPDGRLWVVEMRDYPNGPDKGKPPMGRIRILEDKNGDGFFETATTWADNLLFANGLLLWKDGAIVTMAPNISHLRDTNGAGKADTTDILYEGFAAQNPQLRVSHPILGLDGWIYCANGLRGGKVIRKNPGANAPGSPVDLSGMDFRFDPVTGAYEAITGPGQYGNTFDAWGNRFICDNRHHLRHVVMENRYLKRNPYLAAPALVQDISVLEDGPLSSGGKIYPLSRNWTTSSLHEGRFTAACSVFIYHGKLLDTNPPRQQGYSYHGAAFTCDPTGNLVHMEVLTPKGATFTSKPAKEKVEFLASTDDWFRPVFLTHGPEGAMYVVDMYRAVIEHPDFMPPELQKRPDLWQGKNKGRIWRIVPEKHVTKTPRPNLAKASIAELVKTLEHEEPWWRTTAQRLLLEKNDKAMIGPLTKLLDTTKSPHAKILAAWMLERLKALNQNELTTLLKNPNPRVIEHAVRIAEPRVKARDPSAWVGVASINQHLDARVRFQVALTVGEYRSANRNHLGDASTILFETAENDCDQWMRLALLTAPPDECALMLGNALDTLWRRPKHNPNLLVLSHELATVFGARTDLKGKGRTAFLVEELWRKKTTPAVKSSLLTGLADGLERRGVTLYSLSSELTDEDRAVYLQVLKAVFADAAKNAEDASKNPDERITSTRLLRHAPWPAVKGTLLGVAQASLPALRIAALRTIASHTDEGIPSVLMRIWPSASPPLRREILEAMLRRPERIAVLLDEIEAKRVKASEIDASRTRQLVQYGDPKIRERARKLLQDNLPADRKAALKTYQAALMLKGDAKRGREIFRKDCATCHRVGGVGTDVGPDIADTRTKTLAALLNDILVPNQAIDNNYINYLVSTKDGRVLTGILAAETSTSVTLKRAEGQSDVLLRKDIDEIASTGVSLMPDGLEKNITVQEMADLLRFLKDWRYLDGSVPVNP
jgi:putative membrane-bound dehydrogenase-like protein